MSYKAKRFCRVIRITNAHFDLEIFWACTLPYDMTVAIFGLLSADRIVTFGKVFFVYGRGFRTDELKCELTFRLIQSVLSLPCFHCFDFKVYLFVCCSTFLKLVFSPL